MSTNVVIGAVLIILTIAAGYLWQDLLFWPIAYLVPGAIVWFLFFVGVIFLWIGIEELRAPPLEEVTPPVEEKPKPRRGRRRK